MDDPERLRDGRTAAPQPARWAFVLAGGEGLRLRALTRWISGDERPKQFCRVLSRETLLEQTLGRAALLVAPDRIMASVVRAHELFYAPLLTTVSSRCQVIQPENRGSAVAILYGMLRLLMFTPAGPVVILPSDHYVSDSEAFMAHVQGAFDVVLARPDLVVLLGITPDTDEVEYGWIELADAIGGPWTRPLFQVRNFWEKPSPAIAAGLRTRGCLWNSFVIVANPSALVSLIRHALPTLVEAFADVESRLSTPWEDESLRRLYARLPSTDFSRHVLAGRPANLAVLPLNGVGWNDLGEPRRVLATLAHRGLHPEWTQREMEPGASGIGGWIPGWRRRRPA